MKIREDRALMDLCLEIARGELQGQRFTSLLFETGVELKEFEWEVANKLLGKSDQIQSLGTETYC